MTYYTDYLEEISNRKNQGLHAKPIDNHFLMEEIIQQIKDENNVYRKDSLHFFIYNTLPGTTGAASAKANFLKDASKDKIDGYPSMYMVKDDQVIEFEAQPTEDTLTEFINDVF